jgi:hypothetical protein
MISALTQSKGDHFSRMPSLRVLNFCVDSVYEEITINFQIFIQYMLIMRKLNSTYAKGKKSNACATFCVKIKDIFYYLIIKILDINNLRSEVSRRYSRIFYPYYLFLYICKILMCVTKAYTVHFPMILRPHNRLTICMYYIFLVYVLSSTFDVKTKFS